VPCTTGTAAHAARSTDAFVGDTLSAETAQQRRPHQHIPTFDFANPLSISQGTVYPADVFSLNQTETPRDWSKSYSSLAAPARSSHAWQRKKSRPSGNGASFSTVCPHSRVRHGRTGCDQRGLRCYRIRRRCSSASVLPTKSRTGRSTLRTEPQRHIDSRMQRQSLRSR